MLVLLVSDVHANLPALDAVLAEARAAGASEVWHLGDLVGYGPQPVEVIERLREAQALNVMGNHDAAAAGLITTEDFNSLAAAAVAWTTGRLTPSARNYLAALPQTAAAGDVTCVHGSLRDPLWEYLDSVEAARAHFGRQATRLSVTGHTHLPTALSLRGDLVEAHQPEDGEVVDVSVGRWCLNPGSVGQPRDSDPRASFALYDPQRAAVTFRRVPYAVDKTQALMAAAGLPEPLGRRLLFGR